ncbi:histidine phosphatase family protein [Kineococcus indalonis]|uniref:histidine phosphatase family protein n=1 Tax=Kineococcus indalonis TaxID=2696566 RepID=UPI001411E2FE|nr:histidine phosphatase family protein [Kineococcus indalonis]NAZ87367.1 histidine phosphatase family protein [Kineococcus indalonis]
MSILVVRHGQTAWSLSGQHTGTTDVPLTAVGEEQARALAPAFAGRRLALVLTSPRTRARRTAELAGLAAAAPVEVDDDLVEWDYGGYEGRTTAEVSEELGRPWSVWHDGVVPGATPGETVQQVAVRARAALARAAAADGGDGGDVVLVAHGHFLRVLAACWLGLSPTAGALFALDAGTWGELGHEHGRPVLSRWNVPAGA